MNRSRISGRWYAKGSRRCAALFVLLVGAAPSDGAAQALRGDPAAIEAAQAMVDRMGGMEIWSQLESVRFVHDWDVYTRPDRYREHETLDLSAPRSYVTMDSEIYRRIRAYSPEHGYWNVVNGAFAYASDEALTAAMERAPFSIYRIARGIARGDAYYRVDFGPMPGMEGVTALEFRGPDDQVHGWILLSVRNEPVVWATTQYAYSFGPLARFGNLWVPRWGVTGEGRVRYEMVSLVGSSEPADPALFVPPGGEGAAGGGGVLEEPTRD